MGWDDNNYDWNSSGDEGTWDNTDYVGMGGAKAGDIDYTIGSDAYKGQDYNGGYQPQDVQYPGWDSGVSGNQPNGWDSGISGDMKFNDFQPYGQGQDYMGQEAGTNWGDMGSKALAGLGSLFKGSTGQNLGALLTGYMSDQRNKKTGAAAQNMIQQQARPYDQQGTTGANMAGATSMRDAAQQQQILAQQRLDKFRADPTSDAGYKSQQDQILEAQKRVAAARGVRYNPTSSKGAMSPATLAALAQNQMAYDKNYQTDRNSYFTPAGAGMSGGLAEMLAAMQQQSKGDYYSGLAGGAGFTSANQMNDPDYLAKILQLQQQLKA